MLDPKGNGTQPYRRCTISTLFFTILLLAQSAWAQRPQINSVHFSGSPGNYTLTIKGSGSGSPVVSLPFTGDVSNFRIGDAAQVGHGEWGYTGDLNMLISASCNAATQYSFAFASFEFLTAVH